MREFRISRTELQILKALIAEKRSILKDIKKARILAFAKTFGVFFKDCKLIVVA